MELNSFFNPLIGVVSDNQDPDKLGRLKVVVNYFGEDIETDWIYQINVMSGNEYGFMFIPEVDDQVLVAFIGENIDHAVVLGSLYSEDIQPPVTDENTASDLNDNGENNLKFIKSRSGNMLILDDTDGKEKIQIIAAESSTRWEFLAETKEINILTDENINIETDKTLSFKADEIVIETDQNIGLKGSAINMESSSQDINLTASTNIAIEGTMVKLN